MEPDDVRRARGVVEVREPRVMDEPGARAWLAMMYWECAFGVIVWPSIIIGAGGLAGGVAKLTGDVESDRDCCGLGMTGRM